MTRKEKDEEVYNFLCKLTGEGKRRTEAISKVKKKFSILHDQTVYNIEKRVKARKEKANG